MPNWSSVVPDCRMTAWAMGSEGQAKAWRSMEVAPADWPKKVMRAGSPPKAAMLSRRGLKGYFWVIDR